MSREDPVGAPDQVSEETETTTRVGSHVVPRSTRREGGPRSASFRDPTRPGGRSSRGLVSRECDVYSLFLDRGWVTLGLCLGDFCDGSVPGVTSVTGV